MLSVSYYGQLRERSLVAEENERGDGNNRWERRQRALKKAVSDWHWQTEGILQSVNLFYPTLWNAPKGKLFEKLTVATFVPEAVPHALLALPVLVSQHSLTIRSGGWAQFTEEEIAAQRK